MALFATSTCVRPQSLRLSINFVFSITPTLSI
nr:MAG TPA: hypothetical protein [Caudoviricetes sp.]